MSQVAEPPIADQARAALGRHDWQGAWELLSAADKDSRLGPEELELLAEAAWWMGRLPVAIDARERAYARALKDGRPELAVLAAINLARDHLIRNAHAVATAWMHRAEQLLEGTEEGLGHGWLAVSRSFQSALTGDLDSGVAEAVKAQEIAARFGDRDLEAMAMSCRGFNLLARGDVAEAMPLLDEATLAATAGELEPGTAGGVCCSTIEACTALGDWRRAADWTEAQDRWCTREGINGFPGMCRLFRADVKRFRGDWLTAEAEARRASTELEGFMPAAVGVALYQIGELRLRRGDLTAAEEALRRALAGGRDPEPALSLLRLAQGRITEAQASIGRALDEPATKPSWAVPPNSGLARVALLPARVQIAIAAGDTATARAAAEELGTLAALYGSASIRATADRAIGEVRLAEGDAHGAALSLRPAIATWTELEAPYDLAVTRMSLGRALIALGNTDRATLELGAARDAFERLGAEPDRRTAEALLTGLRGTDDVAAAGPADRLVRTFVFTDIVDSTRFAELLGDEAWAELLRWHDGLIRTVVAEHGGEEIKGTGDGFFLAFRETDEALACAVAIQRRLAEQRQRQGFAPAVRIGLHRAEANKVGLDYSGTGVNLAARIATAAAGAEILVSAPTLEGVRRPIAEQGRREVVLKGFEALVQVIAVAWR